LKLSEYVACICEGAAESAIIDILVDSGNLIFSRSDMLDERVIRCRNAEKFEERYLRKGFDHPISVVCILDSRREKFCLGRAYKHKVDVINIITAPEIEMLIIHHEKVYEKFKRSGKKPGDFCKTDLHMKDVKSYDFVKSYFKDPNVLMDSIRDYRRKANVPDGEYTLMDLLKS